MGGSVFEIPAAHRMIRAIHNGAEENISSRLHQERDAAPHGSENRHANCNSAKYPEHPVTEKVPVEPAITHVRRKSRQRLFLVGLARVVINVSEQNLPKPFKHGTVRVALDIRVAMMLAVNRDPFFRINSG